jgi:hypothetical protein
MFHIISMECYLCEEEMKITIKYLLIGMLFLTFAYKASCTDQSLAPEWTHMVVINIGSGKLEGVKINAISRFESWEHDKGFAPKKLRSWHFDNRREIEALDKQPYNVSEKIGVPVSMAVANRTCDPVGSDPHTGLGCSWREVNNSWEVEFTRRVARYGTEWRLTYKIRFGDSNEANITKDGGQIRIGDPGNCDGTGCAYVALDIPGGLLWDGYARLVSMENTGIVSSGPNGAVQ